MATFLTSNKLEGITADHDGCGVHAPSDSTGRLKELFERPISTDDFGIEYLCSTCGQTWSMYSTKHHELIREVLQDNDIDAL
jgi:hypothetical protein